MLYFLSNINKEMLDYIEKLNFSYKIKDKIYGIYLTYINKNYRKLLSIFNENINENIKVIKNDLRLDFENFKNRINLLVNSNEDAFKYIDFIKNNKYHVDLNVLYENDKTIYKWVTAPSFDIYRESLMYDNHNYVEICQKLHYLAIKFGYTDDLNIDKNKKDLSYSDLSKIPEVIKDATKGVE